MLRSGGILYWDMMRCFDPTTPSAPIAKSIGEVTHNPIINATILIHRSYSSASGSLRAYFAFVRIASYICNKGCAAAGQAGWDVIWRME